MSSLAVQESAELEVAALQPTQFGLWDALVEKSPHGTIFHKTWWLEATGCDFQILGCWSDEGALTAGIAIPRRHKKGLNLFHAPPLTPYLGPIFDLASAGCVRDQLRVMRSQGELLARSITGFDSFSQIAGVTAPDFQGFLWAGFHIEIGYTFRFDAGTTPQEALQGASRTHRQKLKPNRNEDTSMERGTDVDALLELNQQTFGRQGRSAPYQESLVQSLVRASSDRQCGNVYVARAGSGKPLAALFVVHDSRASYQIVSGVDWNEHNSSAGHMTTWRAIEDALDGRRAFDFEGSRMRGVEQYYRRWGAPARTTWVLKKAGSWRGRVATMLLNGRNGAN